ncbi:hypothetical protein TSUD_224680 [Trifolium subterraneum]|uniref:Uncharacterized protein n=1 Tax=Trifolium subterraneum TaxID=3900 RepID=A0A2Z6M354_TRISU|nr:hypothetical protein TSUD_224680 [Trifolium subterraneum]
MAAVAACRRLGILGTNSGIGLTGFGGAFGNRALKFSPSIYNNNSSSKHFSQLLKSNGQRLFLVDTLALVKRLEGQGVPLKQAEAITAAITEVLNDSLENVSQSLVSKEEMQRVIMPF